MRNEIVSIEGNVYRYYYYYYYYCYYYYYYYYYYNRYAIGRMNT